MRLWSVELSRFRTRRAVVVILVVAAALAGLLVASATYDSRPISGDERSAAAREAAQQRTNAEPEYQTCLADPTAYFDEDATQADCTQILPQADWFLNRSALDLGNELDGRGITLLVLLAGTAILVGATFAGADWSSGSMSNQLLFVPRRVRVWVAKSVAVVVGATLLAAAVVAAFWAVLYAVSASRGLHTSAASWRDIAETSGRGIAL